MCGQYSRVVYNQERIMMRVYGNLNAIVKFIIPPSFSALIILGKDFIYNKLETWIFTGDRAAQNARGADQLRKEFEDKYFSECPNNLEKPKFGELEGKLLFHIIFLITQICTVQSITFYYFYNEAKLSLQKTCKKLKGPAFLVHNGLVIHHLLSQKMKKKSPQSLNQEFLWYVALVPAQFKNFR